MSLVRREIRRPAHETDILRQAGERAITRATQVFSERFSHYLSTAPIASPSRFLQRLRRLGVQTNRQGVFHDGIVRHG
jgi:tetraacyldisaccharide-1-P 4'-kinase